MSVDLGENRDGTQGVSFLPTPKKGRLHNLNPKLKQFISLQR